MVLSIGLTGFVKAAVLVKGHAKCPHPLTGGQAAHRTALLIDEMSYEACNDRRIDSAAQVNTDGDICPKSKSDSFDQSIPYSLYNLLFGSWILYPLHDGISRTPVESRRLHTLSGYSISQYLF